MKEPITARQYNAVYVWLSCLVAAMGGLLFGYDWVVIGGAKPFYEPFFAIGESPLWQGVSMSSALIGCLFGAVVAGVLADRYGRRRLLILAGLLFTVSAVGTALAPDLVTFNLVRWLGGVGIGLASNLSPMYIAEISPAPIRGRLVSINQLTIVIGILAAQIVNFSIAQPVPTADQLRSLLREGYSAEGAAPAATPGGPESAALSRVDAKGLEAVQRKVGDRDFLREETEGDTKTRESEDRRLVSAYILPTWNGQYGWRWMFGAETVPALLFFLLMFFVPESPRWLVKYRRDEEARRILTRVGGPGYAEAEVSDIQDTLAREEIAQVHFGELLEPRLRRVLTLGVMLAVLQQWCGINVIFNYAQEVFAAAGYGVSDVMFNIVVTGVVNLAFTFVAIYSVDRVGRRVLILFGYLGLAIIYALLGGLYYLQSTGVHMLLLVILAIACYAMSLAPVTWVVIAEIFPNRIRGAAMAIAVFSLWVGCTALTLSFPFLNRTLGPHGTFWMYGIICLFGFVYAVGRLPETKGKSLEEIERELVG